MFCKNQNEYAFVLSHAQEATYKGDIGRSLILAWILKKFVFITWEMKALYISHVYLVIE